MQKQYNITGRNFDFSGYQNLVNLQTQEEEQQLREESIKAFNKNKTLSNLQICKNTGLKTKVMQSGKWMNLHSFSDDFNEYRDAIELYDKDENGMLILTAIGFYKANK